MCFSVPRSTLVRMLTRNCVPPTEVNDLFAPNSHYSNAGNEFVATTMVKALAPVLAGRGQPRVDSR